MRIQISKFNYFGHNLRFSLSNNLNPALQIYKDQTPKALFWDDIFIGKNGFIYKLQWPDPDPYLYRNISVEGHCLIREDVLAEAPTDKVSLAMAYLATSDPESIVRVSDVYRFVSSKDHDVYEPIDYVMPQGKASSVSIIINYRDRFDLMEKCLHSIAIQDISKPVELVLINNQSTPDNYKKTCQLAKDLLGARFKLTFLDYDCPYNNSRQNNLGAQRAAGEVLLFLNNDVVLLSNNVIESLADWACEPNVASVGPQFVGAKNRLVSAGVRIFKADFARNGFKGFGIQENEVPIFQNCVRQSAGASFACAAVHKNVWKELGGLDEHHFSAQYNDADFDIRALKKGYRHLYIGNLKVFHEPGQTEGQKIEHVNELHKKLCAFIHPYLGQFYKREAQIETCPKKPTFDEFGVNLRVVYAHKKHMTLKLIQRITSRTFVVVARDLKKWIKRQTFY